MTASPQRRAELEHMPKPPSQCRSTHADAGRELAIAVEARSGPAILAVPLLAAAAVVVVLARWLS